MSKKITPWFRIVFGAKKIIRQKNLLKTFNNGILNSVNP